MKVAAGGRKNPKLTRPPKWNGQNKWWSYKDNRKRAPTDKHNPRAPVGRAHTQVRANDGTLFTCGWPRVKPVGDVRTINYYTKSLQVCAEDVRIRRTLKQDAYNKRSNSFAVVNMRALMCQLKRALLSKRRDLEGNYSDGNKTNAQRASIHTQLGYLDSYFDVLANIRKDVNNFARSVHCDAEQIRHARLTIDHIGQVVPEIEREVR
jgi:hypothetical protein